MKNENYFAENTKAIDYFVGSLQQNLSKKFHMLVKIYVCEMILRVKNPVNNKIVH